MVRVVVSSDVHGLPLGVVKFLDDLFLVGSHLFSYWLKPRLQVQIIGLTGKGLRPIQGKIEMTAASVQFINPTGWSPVVLHMLTDGLVQGLGQESRFVVLEYFPDMFE